MSDFGDEVEVGGLDNGPDTGIKGEGLQGGFGGVHLGVVSVAVEVQVEVGGRGSR